jgi:hypothetical protein
MGDYWWLMAPALMLVPVIAIWWQKHHPDEDDEERSACPRCHHEFGLDDSLKHCGEVDDIGGWVSSDCGCQADYHWNYESTAV